MAVRKQCAAKGCKKSPRCDHPWWFDVMHDRVRHRMKVDDFAIPRMKEGERRPVDSKQEAQRVWEPLYIGEILAGRNPAGEPAQSAPRLVGGLIDEYIRLHCEANQLHMSTLRPLLGRLKTMIGHRQVADLERASVIDDVKADLLETGVKVATVNRYLAQLRHMIGWSIGRQYLRNSPFYDKLRNRAGVKQLKGEASRTRRLRQDEEQVLLATADNLFRQNCSDHNHIARVMRARIEVALDYGLRRGEMLKIQNRDIDWNAKPDPILTLRSENTKSGRQRRIPLASTRVLSWLQSRRLVGGSDGHPYGDELGGAQKHFNSAWKLTLRDAGITDRSKGVDGDLRWHDLRHECGSRLAEKGMDIRRLQELLGHASLVTTQRYLNTSTDAVGAGMRQAMGW